MTTFALVTTIAGIIVLAVFVSISIRRFGMQPSYSDFSPCWDEAVPIRSMHLWSIVTFVVAALFMPALIELGEGNPLQFLGFFAPMYLIVVALFPLTALPADASDDERKKWKRKKVIHNIGAALCSAATVSWILFVCRLWWVCLLALALVAAAAFATRTERSSLVFWLEMALFTAGPTAALIML